jgi:hypothetical protein
LRIIVRFYRSFRDANISRTFSSYFESSFSKSLLVAAFKAYVVQSEVHLVQRFNIKISTYSVSDSGTINVPVSEIYIIAKASVIVIFESSFMTGTGLLSVAHLSQRHL